jgi:hypothetical protein
VKTNRSWSLDLKPVYDDPEPYFDGVFHHHYASTLRHVRVAVKSGSREVIVFHAVQPAPPSPDYEENYVYTTRRMADPDDNPLDLDLNPFNQLLADAELGRRVREAGLELKE